MSRNFQLQLVRKALADLGYGEVSEVLAQKMALESDRVHESTTVENPLHELISAGDYSGILAILGEPQGGESGDICVNSGAYTNASTIASNNSANVSGSVAANVVDDEDEFHFSNDKKNMFLALSPNERSLVSYLVLRTAYLEKILLIALGAAGPGADRQAFEFLQRRVSVALDGVERFDDSVPLLQSLTKEHESGVLLPLAMAPPHRDHVESALVLSLVLLVPTKRSAETTVHEDHVYLARLRNSLATLLRQTVGILKPDVSASSMLDYIDIPEDCLADIIHKATLYKEWQSLYHLPPRVQTSAAASAFVVNDYAFLENATRDDLPIHLLHTLDHHTDEVWFTRFSPSGRFLATGSLDGTCMIYDVTDKFRLIAELDANAEDEAPVFVPGSHIPPLDKKKGIIYFSWEPHERYIVTCCLDTVIRVWNVENIGPRRRVTRSMNGAEDVSLVCCFTLGERMRTWPCEFLKYDKASTPHFIVGSPDKVLKVFSIDGNEVLDFYSDADEWLSILGEEPLISSAASAELARSGLTIRRGEDSGNALSEDSGTGTGTGGGGSGGVSQFNRINDFAITPNGRVLITANNDKQVLFYKIPNLFDPSTTTSRIALLTLNGRLTSSNISADGKYLLLSIAPEELQVWDITPLENFEKPFLKQKFLGQSQAVYMVRSCFGYLTRPSMKEKLVLSGSDDGYIYIWKLETGQLVTRVKGHEGLCNSVDWNTFYFSKTGRDYGMYWCSVGDDQLVKIWGPRDRHAKPAS